MAVKTLPLLLSVFAAGCLSGGALIALWPDEPRRVAAGSAPAAAAIDSTDDEADAPTSRRMPPPKSPIARDDDQDVARGDPARGDPAPLDPAAVNLATAPADFGNEPSTEGASLADILIRLEVAYHRARAETDRTAGPAANDASTAPREPVTHDIRVNISDVPSPPDPAPPLAQAPAVAQPALAPSQEEESPRASAEAPAPDSAVATRNAPQIHVAGDVHQTHVAGNVHQGDVNHVQQVAILQYFQFLTLPPRGALGAPSKPHGVTRRRATPFPTNLTDPNNPWGFDFPPTVLVK